MSFSFEDVCKEFVREMQKKNELPFRYNKMGRCKFKKSPFSYSEYLDTLAKLTPMKQKAKFYYALFSENGFDEKIESAAEENDVRLYTLEDIVNYLNP